MVINGSMDVAQRGTSLTMAHDGVQSGYLLDRFAFAMGSNQDTFDGAYSQASDGPDGVSANSILWTTGTAEAAIAGDEIVYLLQTIEAQNCQRLGLGTSASKQVTLSFYVKSSITGTYGVNVYKPDAAGDLTASIVTGTYTISSANTWERKTITFPSGTAASLGITDDNGQGLSINWHLAAGSNYTSADGTSWGDYAAGKWAFGHAQNGVVTTASATWGITGVQMEVGPVATDFEQEEISTTLAKCQRYFTKATGDANLPVAQGSGINGTTSFCEATLPVPMRALPARTFGNLYMYQPSDLDISAVTLSYGFASATTVGLNVTHADGGVAGKSAMILLDTDAGFLAFDAEL
jgi:hypothetical protein